jgi:hypothetical protein
VDKGETPTDWGEKKWNGEIELALACVLAWAAMVLALALSR